MLICGPNTKTVIARNNLQSINIKIIKLQYTGATVFEIIHNEIMGNPA